MSRGNARDCIEFRIFYRILAHFSPLSPRNAGGVNPPEHEKGKAIVKNLTFGLIWANRSDFSLFSACFAHTTGGAQPTQQKILFQKNRLTYFFSISSFYAFLLLFKNNVPPAVSKSRGCAGQFAHPVFFFPASRTHAVVSGCGPAYGSCFPGQGKAPAHPQRTETLEKLSSAPWLFKRFPVSRRFAAERPRKPASSAEKEKIGRRAQAWGSKGRSPFANLCLLSFRKKVEARRGLSDK